MSKLVVLAYDIADEKRRKRVARLCEQRMLRIQESVFEAWLTSYEVGQLLAAVATHIEPRLDQVRLYTLDLRDLGRRRVIGQMPQAAPDPDYYLL